MIYELCALFAGSQTPDQVETQAKQLESLLAAAGASITYTCSMGRRKLAYKLRGQDHGEYRVWYFEAETNSIPAFEQKLRLSGATLRYLLLSLEPEIAKQRIEKAKHPKKASAVKPEEDKFTAKPERKADVSEEKPKEPGLSLQELDSKLDEILSSDKI